MQTVDQSCNKKTGCACATPRRRFLTALWNIGLFALVCQSLLMVVRFFQPGNAARNGGGVIDLGSITDIPAIGEPPKLYREGKFWLVHTEQGVNAYDTACTHLHCLFSWNSEAEQFVCPCHGSRFDRNGVVLQGPAPRDLDRYPVRILDAEGSLLRETDEQGRALSLPVPEQPDSDKEIAGPLPRVQVDTHKKIAGIRRHV